MRRHGWLVIAFGLIASCSSSRPEREYINEKQDYAVAQPDGWEVTEVRGFAQLTPRHDDKRKKHTIVIRAADKPAQIKEGSATTHAELIATTERVLRALPGARLTGKKQLDGTELPAIRFSLSFQPSGVTRPYRREHTLLIGSRHVYHVIYTSPANEPIDEVSFKRVVNTLSEEG